MPDYKKSARPPRPGGDKNREGKPRPSGDKNRERPPRPSGDKNREGQPRPSGYSRDQAQSRDLGGNRDSRPSGDKNREPRPAQDSRPSDCRRDSRPPQERRGEGEPAAPQVSPDVICGRNAVTEALRAGRGVNKVWLADNNEAAFSAAIFKLCQAGGVPCHTLPRAKLNRLAGPEHRGVAAELAAAEYVEVADILEAARAKNQPPFVILLDGVEDPHNLGAIIRTALCVGAHGLILPKRRAAALNQTVLVTSAGAAHYLPLARVANLGQALDELKKAGCWAVAADMDGQSLWQTDLKGPVALVLGGEGAGLSPLLKKRCDLVASIPMQGEIGSLNVSNAAAVMMYEILRQRG